VIDMEIRVLGSADAEQCQALRLQALRECPTAFSSSYEEERETPLTEVARRLATSDTVVFGAFAERRLVGTAALHRETRRKRAHVAVVWGMYVDPDFRHRGVGRKLLERLLEHATALRGLHKVTLGVNAANPAAIALYQAVGFERFCVEPGFLLVDGVLQDEIHMAYFISEP
jgi:RimJ/RimL family protein N-acetyltransferase